ncbi:TerD family protein [Streptomyces sp. NBC_01310]|uniref:TerD family protein n=1 Tax=Streptomyces sp. NBC_01310 TaxID=2903820 RepID=UPI0035B592CD|nr:TerD family protein [Streptomyces sp. NBC_01310]WSJ63731.1 TerD family protein [Streptomyces sp. NBC_01310]
MSHIAKGANSFVPTVALRVAVRHEPGPGAPLVEAAALLLDASGRARGDGDMVFHGRPLHPSAAVRHMGGAHDPSVQWLELDLPRIEADVERVLVVCSTDNGTVGALAQPTVEAFAPDGVPVVRYTVTDATTETAFVFGEFYRRAGGWKFRAVSQGYASGLAGLTTDFGLAVAAVATAPAPVVPLPAPASPGPVPLAGVSRTSAPVPFAPPPPPPPPPPVSAGQVPFAPPPHPAPAAAPTAIPSAVPVAVPTAPIVPPSQARPGDAWTFGPVFEPYTVEGKGSQVVTADRVPPGPGPVLVEMTHEGDGYLCVQRLDERNKDDHLVFNSLLKNFRGSAAVDQFNGRRLRLRVQADKRWTLTFRPLVDARRLELGHELTGRGPEALLYTGPVADLKVRLRDEEGDGGYWCMRGYEVAGHTTIAAATENLLVNEVGRSVKVSSPLPEGPLLVLFDAAEGPWRIKLRAV